MDEILRTVFSPINVISDVRGYLIGAALGLIFRFFSTNALQRLSLSNAVVIGALIMLGYGPGEDNSWLLNFSFGLAVGMFYLLAAAAGERTTHAVVLFALNAPAVYVLWHLPDAAIEDKTSSFFILYSYWSTLIGTAVAFWVMFACDTEEALHKVVGIFRRPPPVR